MIREKSVRAVLGFLAVVVIGGMAFPIDSAGQPAPAQDKQLSTAEREELKEELSGDKWLDAVSLGYGIRGQDNFSGGAVISQIPESLDGADVSVCGVKGFMIDQRREFTGPDGEKEAIPCATVAALEITDSPVHVHSQTLETYVILEGEGKMVLDDSVHSVKKGNVILIPPNVHHGIVSTDPDVPVKVLLTFAPGLAPKEHPRHRDEQIIHARASKRVQELTGQ